MNVGIINFNMGNISSVVNAINFLGCSSKIINSIEDFDDVTHFILPGVGSFKDAMINLKSSSIEKILKKKILIEKKKILGICLGMQLLGSSSTENGFTEGLSFIKNKIEKISMENNKKLTLPHVGFNNINIVNKKANFFNNIDELSNFYFVHSYKMEIGDFKQDYAICEYGQKFLAAFKKNNIYGVQFHPEKSQSCGLELIYNFLKY